MNENTLKDIDYIREFLKFSLRKFSVVGADYMTNFSSVSRAEISARFPEQISLKKTFSIT